MGTVDCIEQVRLRYRPATVNALFVGESVPAGGTFFYCGNSHLCRYTQQAFSLALDIAWPTSADFLAFFAAQGCYLEDLCPQPVNHLGKAERERARMAAVPSLAARMREIRPKEVLVAMKRIELHVRSAIHQAGSDGIPIHAFPFPAMGNQPRYVKELAKALRKLVAEDVLPGVVRS